MGDLSMSWLLIFVGLGAIALELFLGVEAGFEIVLIGAALVVGGLIGNITGVWQIGVLAAGVLVVLYIYFGRKIVKNKLLIKTQDTNIDSLIGKTGRVVRKITKSKAGQVRVGSETWRAKSSDVIEQGAEVKIESVEGVSLNVVE